MVELGKVQEAAVFETTFLFDALQGLQIHCIRKFCASTARDHYNT